MPQYSLSPINTLLQDIINYQWLLIHLCLCPFSNSEKIKISNEFQSETHLVHREELVVWLLLSDVKSTACRLFMQWMSSASRKYHHPGPLCFHSLPVKHDSPYSSQLPAGSDFVMKTTHLAVWQWCRQGLIPTATLPLRPKYKACVGEVSHRVPGGFNELILEGELSAFVVLPPSCSFFHWDGCSSSSVEWIHLSTWISGKGRGAEELRWARVVCLIKAGARDHGTDWL